MEAWIGSVRSLANRLTAIDVTVSDEDIIVVLTAGLPPSYETVLISLDAVEPTQLTLDFVITRLLNEESRQASSLSTSTSTPAPDDPKEAMVASKRGANVICFYCGGTGHFAASCETRIKHFKALDDKFAGSATIFGDDPEEENYAF
ncbi:hypothetical protein H0H92_003431 [Tricholoma furcatifolium]|nr:hypothetical protein H0H92_003431 [Tricholoma furcatifolium]